MQVVNLPINYIGAAFTYFCFHVEDDHLALVSYLEKGAAKVWYVRPSQHMTEFGRLLSRYLFNLDCPNDSNDGGSQIFALEAIIFNPCIPRKLWHYNTISH